MNITHDMSNDLTEYDPESRQVDGPNPIENRISSSAARVPDIISCTSGITVQGRQLHSFAFTTDAAIIRNTNADAILAGGSEATVNPLAIGGFANWVQDAEYTTCPHCGKPMKYLAQIQWDTVFDCAEGTLYVEFCPDCHIVSMQHQQT